ncbi:MAG: insulinase family protein [Blastocatellia bacterium]|jgi:predicted Zn-dependent peptidase|nr:insulinase family protein [Blastocatellia bacterium]
MIQATRLDNGVRIVTERMPHVRSASVGVWIETGSRHEPAALNGISHFIEHAIFKGTSRRTAKEIAIEGDRQGGNLNASTGQETTCVYTRVLDEQLGQAIDLIADMLTDPAFLVDEIERERQVILEEIKMVEDTPDELIHDIFAEHFWPDHAFGRPVAGTLDTVASLRRDDLVDYHAGRYRADGMIVAAAGNLDHEAVVAAFAPALGRLAQHQVAADLTAPRTAPAFVLRSKPELEQAHLVLGTPCPVVTSPDRYAANLMSAILGDGMSSRLFQRIREERGLVYGIYSSVDAFLDTGVHAIGAGASPENLPEVVELIMEEVGAIKRDGPTEDELRFAKEQYKVATVLSLESTFNRMSRLARHEMVFGRQIPVDEVLKAIDAVTCDDVTRVANDIFHADAFALAALGDIEGIDLDRQMLAC